jgi:general stress protein 26
MANEAEIEAKFWKSVRGDRTVMLGLTGDDGHAQPMTAQTLDEDEAGGPIWFFSAKDTDLVRQLGGVRRATLNFSSKGHDLFASVQGELTATNDRAVIERLWNPFVAAWYEGGKDDPKLQLLRFDAEHAHIWLNENSLMAGVKVLLGRDPKRDYKDKVADLQVGRH